MTELNQPVSVPQPPATSGGALVKPHRGVVVLVLGILGIVVCFICGIFAWVMGKNDLREMDAGIMDPAGRGITKAGKICGMIGTILGCLWFFFMLISLALSLLVFATRHERVEVHSLDPSSADIPQMSVPMSPSSDDRSDVLEPIELQVEPEPEQ